MLREVPLGLDGDFSYDSLIGRYNSELANDLGNLLGRATAMTAKYCDGKMPAFDSAASSAELDKLLARVGTTITAAQAAFDEFAPSRALEEIWALVRDGNRFVDACQPWKMAKDETQAAALGNVLRSVFEALASAARLFWPVMPAKAAELLRRLGLSETGAAELAATWPKRSDFGTQLDGASVVERGGLFPRIEEDRAAELLDRWIPDDAKVIAEAQAPAPDEGPKVSFADFQRFEFRAAKVLSAEPVPKTKKLLAVRLDVGELGERQVVAGIAEAYKAEELVGKTVIFLANLEPATIRGVKSEGMILAAGDKTIAGLSTLDRGVDPGTIVR